MFFKQFYLGCLAHASYMIGSSGEAAVVDPRRDVDEYIEEARANGLEIKYVIETHLHADFVSGHRELAERTGAEIVFGRKAGAAFPHRAVKDGDQIAVGAVVLRFLETPGHTPESISVLVIDSEVSDKPAKVLTGDALFIGDVGRPDLVAAKGYTPSHMAGLLYDALHEKLLRLDDDVEVYPAHGAGSMCGRNIGQETWSTIGEQRQTNYALKPMPRDEFVRMMTTDLPDAPPYFSRDAEINRAGAPALEELRRPTELSPQEVQSASREGSVVLDVRPAAAFGNGHVAGALNIGLSGQFASWAGTLIPPGAPIVIVADDPAGVDEAITRLARVGIESVKGYLAGGMYAWHEAALPVVRIEQMPVDELKRRIAEERELLVVDVRRPAEYDSGHVPGALSIPLASLKDRFGKLDPRRPTAIICATGYRSSAASSLLAPRGFEKLFNIVGGTSAWISAGFATERG